MSHGASAEQQSYLLVAGIGFLLVSASLTGMVLKRRTPNGRAHATIDNLNARIHSWWLIAATFGIALWAGRDAIVLLFAAASMIALREFCPPRAGTRIDRLLYRASFWLAIPLQYVIVLLEWHGLFVLFLPACAAALLLFAVLRSDRGDASAPMRLAAGLLVCAYAVSHVPALLMLDSEGGAARSVFLVLFVVLITQLCDVLQYLWGKALGRRPIAPRVSPQKTVEGTLGGIASAGALGALLAPITPFTVAQAATIALVVALLGFAGGLMLSAIKRSRGIKDWSDLIPGHGGMLDRLDSLVLSGPFFYYALSLGVIG